VSDRSVSRVRVRPVAASATQSEKAERSRLGFSRTVAPETEVYTKYLANLVSDESVVVQIDNATEP
jgi:hypothetical protein